MRDYRYDHVHLRSANPSAMADFFETMFGAEVMRDIYPPRTPARSIPASSVSACASEARLLIAPMHPYDATGAAPTFPYYGLEHMGLTVDNVDAACAELKAKGADVAIGPLTRSPGLRLAFIRGPEGIMVELVQR
jgi:lactoylglutathione lyase